MISQPTMTLAVGDEVSRRGSTVKGVVLGLLAGGFVKAAFPDGVVEVKTSDLETPSEAPEVKLAKGILEDSAIHLARIRAIMLDHAYQYDEAAGLSSARVEPAAHQVFVAHRVMQKLFPRMILADEVGLGKTIEAGLIVKEMRARRQLDRCIAIVPASLTEQWRTELERKFNEHFIVLDGPSLRLLRKGGANPWSQVDFAICSLNLATNSRHSEELVEAGWDLVIFDEAHRVRRTLRGGEASANQAYRLAEELKAVADGLLLLTATPVQLHQFELFSLLDLVEPGMFPSYGEFESKRKQLPQLNELMRTVQQWSGFSPSDREESLSRNRGLLADLDVPLELDSAAGRERVLDALAEQHPMAGALVRNRKHEIGMVSVRLARRVPVPMNSLEADLYEEVTSYLREGYRTATAQKNNAFGFLMVTYQKMLTSSSTALRRSFEKHILKLQQGEAASVKRQDLDLLREAEDLSTVADDLAGATLGAAAVATEIAVLSDLVTRLKEVADSKAAALLEVCSEILDENPNEKIVVFTQFRETQNYLAYALRQNHYTVEAFHGGLRAEEKEAVIQRFRDHSQVLISTEAGGEGRNLQFCHFLVNYDLPWNPMRIEQRIGRLDRYGQKHPVVIYNLAYEGTVEDRVLDVLEQRIQIFTESVGALDPILGDVEADIQRLVMADVQEASGELERYSEELGQRVRMAHANEEAWKDFALDRASLRRDRASELLGATRLATPRDLQSFVEDFLSVFGGTVHPHPEGALQISLSSRLASQLRLPVRIYRGAFDPEEALGNEDRDFFSIGHALIDAILRHCRSLSGGDTGARRSSTLPPGVYVEVVYRVVKRGQRPGARLVRYLVAEDISVTNPTCLASDLVGRPRDITSPDWVADGLSAAAAAWTKDRAALHTKFSDEFETARGQRIERARRLARHREHRDRERRSQLQEWLRERRDGMSARDRKILPAQEGRLKKIIERLERLEADIETELTDIENEQPVIEFELLWTGLVEGQG